MTDIQIHSGTGLTTTCVPNAFIDEYMPDANGEFVKIYLYLLRVLSTGDGHLSISAMADKFHYTENDVRRGLLYWEQLHLLQLEYDDANHLTGICMTEGRKQQTVSAPASVSVPMTAAVSVPADLPAKDTAAEPPQTRHYSPNEIVSFKNQKDVAELLYISEHYIGHPLNMTEIEKILFWFDELKFSVDMIEYLVEYCVEKGHPSFHYMNKVALNWKESGIRTLAEAQSSANIHSQSYYAVMKAFGISGRNLTDRETGFIHKWTSSYGFTLDIINEACARTIRNTGKSNFEYADSILKSWNQKGIHHLEDIAHLDEAYASSRQHKTDNAPAPKSRSNRFHNFEQRQYDEDYYEALEQQLLRK